MTEIKLLFELVLNELVLNEEDLNEVTMIKHLLLSCKTDDERLAVATRLVDCSIACAGMKDPEAEITKLREEVEYWKSRAER